MYSLYFGSNCQFVEWFKKKLYLMNITYFQVMGMRLQSGRHAMAADDVNNINFGFKQFLTTWPWTTFQ